jgi:hypothetical protein
MSIAANLEVRNTRTFNNLNLTAPELSGLRNQLQLTQRNPEAASLLRALYQCWCHSACAVLSLCMLAQAVCSVRGWF